MSGKHDPKATQEQLFDAIAAANNVTTFSQQAPNGGVFIWVTAAEKDPLKALLKAAMTIVTSRGNAAAPDSPISITKLTVFAPGQEFYWQVQSGGAIIAHGYAADREEASREIVKHLGSVF